LITLPRLLRPGAVTGTRAAPPESGSGPDGWSIGTTPAGNEADAAARLQSVQSKFLNAVLTAANGKGLGFVVQLSAPNKGSGFIQRTDGFSNLYSFQFEFGEDSAVLVLGAQGTGGTDGEDRRLAVPYSDGARMDAALDEIRTAIDGAAREVYPELKALRPKTEEAETEGSTGLNSLRRPVASAQAQQIPANQEAYRVWTSGVEKRTRDPAGLVPQHHWLRNGLAVLLVVFLLFLLPVLSTSGSSGPCTASGQASAGCPAPTNSYRASITGQYLGFGAEYGPPGLSPGPVAGSVLFVNATSGNSTSGYALGDWSYYIVFRF
jgi:hypothetical protein